MNWNIIQVGPSTRQILQARILRKSWLRLYWRHHGVGQIGDQRSKRNAGLLSISVHDSQQSSDSMKNSCREKEITTFDATVIGLTENKCDNS